MKKYLVLLSALLLVSFNVNAAVINFGEYVIHNNDEHQFNEKFDVAKTTYSNAIITLNLSGDFKAKNENLKVKVSGYKLGKILNSNPLDDEFDFFNDVVVNESPQTIITGKATISQAVFANLISNGKLNLVFNISSQVRLAKISGTIAYDDIAAVPVPAAAFLFAPALLGFLGLRRKSKTLVA